jgi:hypothetical protein
MNTGTFPQQESGTSDNTGSKRIRKAGALLLVLAVVAFATSGCYDERYGHRGYRSGYYANTAPYYGGYDPYYDGGGYSPYYGGGYGYGYAPATSVGIGISTGRSRYYGRPRYRNYGRSARYQQRSEYRTTSRRAAVRDRVERKRAVRQNPPPETDADVERLEE